MKKFVIVCLLIFVVAGLALSQAKPGGIARQAAMGGSQAGFNLVLNPFIWDDPALLFINPAYQANYKDYLWSNIGGGSLSYSYYSPVKSHSTGSSAAPDINDNGYGMQNAGIAFGIDDQLTIGTIFSYDPSAINDMRSIIGAYQQYPYNYYGSYVGYYFANRSTQYIPPVENVWELVAAYKASSMTLGLGVMYGWSNDVVEFDSTGTWMYYPPSPYRDTTYSGKVNRNTEASASMLGFRAGVNFDMGNGSSFDVSGAIRLNNVTDNMSQKPLDTLYYSEYYRFGGEYSASGTEIELQARGKFKVSKKFNFVPYGKFAMVSAEPTEDANVPLRYYEKNWLAQFPSARSFKMSGTAIQLGIGGEYKTESFYFAGGLSWQYGQVKEENSTSYSSQYGIDTLTYRYSSTLETNFMALPMVNLGGEWWVTDWLACRLGYFRSIGSMTEKWESDLNQSYHHDNTTTNYNWKVNYENDFSMNHSSISVGGLHAGNYDGLVTLGVGLKFGGFALDATVSEEALRRGFGLIGSADALNTFGYMTASYNFTE